MENVASLKKILDSSVKVTVVVHTHPDGDALGSGRAMTDYLTGRLGKDARLIIPDSVPHTLTFLQEGFDVLDASQDPEAAEARIAGSDLILILDLNQLHRTEQLAGPASRPALRAHGHVQSPAWLDASPWPARPRVMTQAFHLQNGRRGS